MKKKLLSLLLLFTAVASIAQVTITPSSFNVTDQITITVSTAAQACNLMGTTPTKVYMHAGIGDDSNTFGFSVSLQRQCKVLTSMEELIENLKALP